MLDAAGQPLRDRLLALFRRPLDRPIPDDEFDRLARDAFAYQFARNAPYAAYCRTRGRTPDTVDHWTRIPAVPTAAFKHVTLTAGPADHAEAVFRTSGTTHGAERRGTHRILDLSLYHASLLPAFRGFVLPDDAPVAFFSLLPPARELEDSSLAHMVDLLLREHGHEHGGWFASVERGLHERELDSALEDAADAGRPVCLLGTSLSFVNWLESLRGAGRRHRLPPGSRLMDTGGYKGSGRTIPVERMLADYRELLGLEPDFCINEYGMTELCSQCYDAALRDRVVGTPGTPRKAGPPWLRTRVVDAETLEPLPDGQRGILQHFDLANLGSVMAVQTEDIGVAVTGGFQLLGRITDAPPRGCSIAMDDLLRAARERA